MKELTILVTCCLGDYMKGTIECYKKNPEYRKIRVVGTDMNDMIHNHVGVDSFHKVPRCTDPYYIDIILNICCKEKVDVVIPCNTSELELFALNRREFDANGTKVIVSNPISLRIANDKILSSMLYERLGFDTTNNHFVKTYDSLIEVMSRSKNLLVIKRRDGCGGRGFRIIGNDTRVDNKPDGVYINEEELLDLFDGKTEYLVQPYLIGKEYSVDYLVDNGKILYSVAKENTNMENGVARKSVVIDKKFKECELVCKTLKLNGNIGFDLKEDKNGVPHIIDCNPRLTATVSLANKAGVNLPYLALKLALGEKINKKYKVKHGVSIHRVIQDVFYDENGDLIE